MQTITFPVWPRWNFEFPERDVRNVAAVRYYDPNNQLQTLDEDLWRMATSRHGVCALVLVDKPNLPPTATRSDAVTIEYEP